MNFCAERGYMDKVSVVMPKYETELKELYTDEEMSKLLEKPITNSWIEWCNWAMVNYFFSTGQRLSSVLNVRIKDRNSLSHLLCRSLRHSIRKETYTTTMRVLTCQNLRVVIFYQWKQTLVWQDLMIQCPRRCFFFILK